MKKKTWLIIGIVVVCGAAVAVGLSMKKRQALRETWMQYGGQFSFEQWMSMSDLQRQAVIAAQSEAPGTGVPVLATPGISQPSSPFDFSKLSKTLSELFARKPKSQNA